MRILLFWGELFRLGIYIFIHEGCVIWSKGWQRVGCDLVTEQQHWVLFKASVSLIFYLDDMTIDVDEGIKIFYYYYYQFPPVC